MAEPAGNSTVDLCVTTGRVELLAAAGESGLRKFALHAYTGGLVNLPNYDVPVVFELSSMQTQPNVSQLPILRDHDVKRGVGHSADVSIGPDGVTGTAVMSVPGYDRDTVVAAADNGKEWQLSVGGSAPESSISFIASGQSFRMNNRTLHGPALAVKNYLLREITFTEAGADATGAFATLLAAYSPDAKGKSTMFEKWLQARGFDLATLTVEGKAALMSQFNKENAAGADTTGDDIDEPGESVDDADVDDAIADSAGTTAANEAIADSVRETVRETTAAEHERVGELETLNAQFGDGELRTTRNGQSVTLLAAGIRDGWDSNRFELEARRLARPQRMAPSRSGGGAGGRVAMLAAMTFAIMAHGNVAADRDYRGNGSAREYLNASLMADPNSDVRDAAMNASHEFRHHSLVDLVASAMELDDVECTAPKKSDRWFQAAFASNSVQDLFTQSTQAILLDSYMQNMATYANFAAIVDQVDVPNFLANERKSVSPDSGELNKLNPTETAQDATLTAAGEEYKISRFALKWGIDDQDMINENFGVFRTMPQFLGMSAARLFGQAIAKLLLTNPNMADAAAWLSTGAGNLRTSSALTAANLKAALTQFGTQTDGNVSLELDPNTLFVPKALRFTAAEIINGAPLITGNTTTQTSANVLAGTIDNVVHSALLDNGFNDPDDRSTAIAGEADGWFLFDTRYPAIEVGHLQGSGRGPTIRTGTYDNGRYGVWFDVKRDLGAAVIRRESVQKNEA